MSKPRLTLALIKGFNRATHGLPCGLGDFLKVLSPEEVETVKAALGDTSVAATAVHKALASLGYKGAANSLRLHRRRECSTCFLPGGPLA
jgi:hypothetical protein